MATNIPHYGLSFTARTARNLEYAGEPFSDTGIGTAADPALGCNSAGSNAPGIGIATGNVDSDTTADLRPEQWTLNTQTGAPRTAQNTQHIGGIVDTAPPYNGIEYPSPAEVGIFPVRFYQEGGDFNDTANFVVADTAASPGNIADTVTGTVNQTGTTIAIGNVLWGNVPV